MDRGKSISVAVTGASGAPYALRLLANLLPVYERIFVMISGAGRVVLATETGLQLPKAPRVIEEKLAELLGCEPGKLEVVSEDNWMSPVASGSSAPRQMVVCPCSTGTLSAIACGASDNIIERAADVVLKEKGQLILVPRETPMSVIHLENQLQLARAGATILPASPGFYQNPESVEDLVDFVVARILDHLGVEQKLVARWGYNSQPD